MRKLAILLVPLLILVLVVGAMGCGGGNGEGEPTPTPKLTPTLTPTPTPTPTPTQEVEPSVVIGASRSNPAPLEMPLTVSVEDILYDVTREFRVTVLEAIRGGTAWDMIQDANMFNEPPGSGNEYILVRARVEYTKGPAGETADISSYSFDLVSADGRVYDHPWVVEPEPILRADLFPGASVEGWMAWEVPQSDVSPVLAFEMDYRGRSDAWFALR